MIRKRSKRARRGMAGWEHDYEWQPEMEPNRRMRIRQGEEPIPQSDARFCSASAGPWYDLDVTKRVRKVLGLTATIPKSFNGEFDVDGRRVVVYRSGEVPKAREHRVWIALNSGRLVPAGRMRQAACGVKGTRGRGVRGRFVSVHWPRRA